MWETEFITKKVLNHLLFDKRLKGLQDKRGYMGYLTYSLFSLVGSSSRPGNFSQYIGTYNIALNTPSICVLISDAAMRTSPRL